MISTMIDFADCLLAALLVGGMFGVWLMLNPARQTAGLYITLHQQGIRTLNTALPAFGATTVVLSLVGAVLARAEGVRFPLLAGAAVCFAAAGLITRFRNQRINRFVIAWKSEAPPANWADVRDEWLRWHLIRFLVALGGLALLVAAAMGRG